MIYVVELVSVNSVGGGLLLLCSYFGLTDCSLCSWITSYRCMLVITLLLHMLYVIGFYYFSMLMVRYCRYYTVVTYDICVMASVAR